MMYIYKLWGIATPVVENYYEILYLQFAEYMVISRYNRELARMFRIIGFINYLKLQESNSTTDLLTPGCLFGDRFLLTIMEDGKMKKS